MVSLLGNRYSFVKNFGREIPFMKSYVIGIDFGTLSGRCVVVDARDGREMSESVFEYPHGVMDEALPDGTPLPPMFALQHPADYLDVLKNTIPDAMAKAGVSAEDVAAIAVDFTSCTVLPTYEDGTPLCFDEKYKSEPHAYVKLWKHVAPQAEADRMNAVAKERNEKWLDNYGGKLSASWLLPKAYEMLNKAPAAYADTARFYEAGDWVALMVTGVETHSAAFAGYKAAWNEVDGYPSREYFAAVDERLCDIVGTKISEKVVSKGIAGCVSKRGAELTGLCEGTPFALAMPDAHVMLAATGTRPEGEMLMVVGTSGCDFVNTREKRNVPGSCGCVKDAILGGYYTYESGLLCIGDGFDRFVKNYVPEAYSEEARERKIGIHKLLREKARRLGAGQSGLLALNWFNGNRTPLNDSELSGMILGLTLKTKPEEIYRAMIEATAYATRIVVENYEKHGISIGDIVAAGGIARKDDMMMQIYADVTGHRIKISTTAQGGSLGSAMYAAVAAGIYKDIFEACENMSAGYDAVYEPIAENVEIYNKLFEEYLRLQEYFGGGENDVMKRLIKLSAKY